jgi:flagellin
MSSFINTNLASLNAQRNLSANQGELSRSIQRLSSGLRVNSAKDDAAGLAIANRMDAQARGMTVAIRNASDGISMAQVAEGALGKIGDMLQRMRELAVQAANATNGADDRASLDAEFQQLSAEISRTVASTKFNGTAVLGADAADGFTFHVGAGTTASVDTVDVRGKDFTIPRDVAEVRDEDDNVTTPAAAGSALARLVERNANGVGTHAIGGQAATLDPDTSAPTVTTADVTAATIGSAIQQVDAALDEINSERSKWGATQNRFEAVISNLQVGVENQLAAKSRIMDADFARETAALTRSQILQQAGTAMLAQANQVPQQVLQLLQR